MDLYVLADGLHCMRYAENYGLKPAVIFWRNRHLRERLPFITGDAALLVILQGCTTMKVIDVTPTINAVLAENVFTEVCVYSNIELPDLQIGYYLYNGDIFSGNEQYITADKKVIKSNKKAETYINKFLQEPYISKKTDIVSRPYNAGNDRIVLQDNIDVLAIDVFK